MLTRPLSFRVLSSPWVRHSSKPPSWGSMRFTHRVAVPFVTRAAWRNIGSNSTPLVRWMCTSQENKRTTTSQESTRSTVQDDARHAIQDDAPLPKLTWRDFFTPSGVKNLYLRNKGSMFSYVVIGFVGLAIYQVIHTGYSLADFFVNISFYDVATVSFTAGLVTAGVIAVILSYTRRLFVIRPEMVYQSVLARVKSDPRVVDLLGRDIQPGKFRAYSLSSGGVQLVNEEPTTQYQGWERFWKPRKLQMMFQLEGTKEKGMVSFEAKKEFNGDVMFTTLTLDGLQSGQKLILEGDGSNKVYRGVIKLR